MFHAKDNTSLFTIEVHQYGGVATVVKVLVKVLVRFVYQDKISTYETLIVKNGYSTLANQRLAKIINTVFGAIGNGNVSKTISELLTARNSNYNLCGDAILKLPKVNSAK